MRLFTHFYIHFINKFYHLSFKKKKKCILGVEQISKVGIANLLVWRFYSDIDLSYLFIYVFIISFFIFYLFYLSRIQANTNFCILLKNIYCGNFQNTISNVKCINFVEFSDVSFKCVRLVVSWKSIDYLKKLIRMMMLTTYLSNLNCLAWDLL